ncbi:hypothetical protein EDC96DRAFT_516573 [Choanephora cucurbitarum]|nr:hypothetical protein EDC96DRAFT_516573 [Choanephora cucurbitarum]
MSEIALSHTYNYSNPSIMVNTQPELVHESTSSAKTSHSISSHENNYTNCSTYAFQPVPVELTPVSNYNQSTISRLGYYQQTMTTNTEPVSSANALNSQNISIEVDNPEPKISHAERARVKEIITRANSVPTEFYQTEFLEYSKENYDKKTEAMSSNKRKRTRSRFPEEEQMPKHKKICALDSKGFSEEEFSEEDREDQTQEKHLQSNAEIRRKIHIQSEQRRRAQIKSGFDELRKHLPGCNIKKMSKAALLTRTIQQLQHLKGMQNELLSEVERLLLENESLKKLNRSPSTYAFF